MAKIQISKARWREERDFNTQLEIPKEPQAGDLILMSFGADDNTPNVWGDESNHVEIQQPKIFEIMYSEREPDKQQLRGKYYYELTLRLFDHSNEDISYVNTDSNGDTQENYIFNEQELTNNLKTSGLDAIFANIDPITGEESGNIVDVVKTAQNRDLEIAANEVSNGRRNPSTDPSDQCGCDCSSCECEGCEGCSSNNDSSEPLNCNCECCECCKEAEDGDKELICDNTLDGNPFNLPPGW